MGKLELNNVENLKLRGVVLEYTEKGTNTTKQVATYVVSAFGIDIPVKAYDITGAKILEKYYFKKTEEKEGD